MNILFSILSHSSSYLVSFVNDKFHHPIFLFTVQRLLEKGESDQNMSDKKLRKDSYRAVNMWISSAPECILPGLCQQCCSYRAQSVWQVMKRNVLFKITRIQHTKYMKNKLDTELNLLQHMLVICWNMQRNY